MTARNHETEAPTGAGQVALADFIDRDARLSNPLTKSIKIAPVRDLESREIHARRLRRPQNYAVAVEFVPSPEIDASVIAAAHSIEPDPVDVMSECRIHVENTELDVAGSQYSGDCHASLPCFASSDIPQISGAARAIIWLFGVRGNKLRP